MKKLKQISGAIIFFLVLIHPVWAQNDYVYFKNFVRHVASDLCQHVPPATGFTVYLNQDQSRILIDNAPRWSSGAEPNIPGNGTFGVELGNFRDPSIANGDSVFIRFTCNTSGQQATLKSQVSGIPWYYFPVTLYLQGANLPEPPTNLQLSVDTLTSHRTVSWSSVVGIIYDVYRREYSDTLADGQVRMMYQRMATGLNTNSFTDLTTIASEKYGYIVYAVNGSGIKSSHSEEVNEDPYIRPGMDLGIKYITRLPHIPYEWGSPDPVVEGWPAVNSTVTWRAVLRNWSDSTLSAVSYRWILDGIPVDSGYVIMPAGDTTYVDYPWTWTFDRHLLAFVIDASREVPEEEEENNRLEVFTNAITAGFYVEQSVYDYFHQYQKLLGVGSNSWEDWAHRHILLWNRMFAAAIYPDSPNGVLDRIRLDKITVVPDGTLPIAGGLPSNNPNLNDRYVDLQWGFNVDLLSGTFYSNHTGVSMNNPFYFEGSLLHELGHARYLIDLYGFNVHDNGSGTTVAIRENGQLIVGTPYMPLMGDAVYLTPIRGLMNGQYTWIDEYSTVALNLITGHRAILGNYNAPGNIGVFLQDLPAQNQLLLKDQLGSIIPNASVRVYQAVPQAGVWYGKYYDDIPDLTLNSDANGMVFLGRCPFAVNGVVVHTYGHSNVILIIRVEYQGKIGYGFVDAAQFNMEYWRGHQSLGYYELSLEMIDPTGIEIEALVPGRFTLEQNFPNPFNPETDIRYQLTEKSPVVLAIYNVLGEKVKTLVQHPDKPAGSYTVRWNGDNDAGIPVSGGIYFYRLEAGTRQFTRKMILMK